MPEQSRKRALIVNAYVDDARRPTRRPTTVLKSMAPVFLAGAFDRSRCDVRLWDEQSSGPLENPDLLGWPDLLVLTGMSAAFDRMLHLTAYARTKNPKVIVAAGGPPIRTLPRYSQQFFDYCCDGDVEQMVDVVAEALGTRYADPEMLPRYDLAYWLRQFGQVESTRNCNFACAFCSMTAEGQPYRKYDLEFLRHQIVAGGRRRFLTFIDNNFYGNDREHFLARLELIGELHRQRWFGGWGALVTSDFFLDPDNLERARAAGCQALFCGLESFDNGTLGRFKKKQNTVIPQVELVRRCLESGILLVYGMIADVTTRTVSSIRQELEFVTGCTEITLPTFVVLPIPFPGTPFFRQLARDDRLLPGTRLRDLDGTTLCLQPRDSVPEVGEFVRGLQKLRGHRWRVLRHALGFVRRYRRSLSAKQLAVSLVRDLSLAGISMPGRRSRRTHVSTTEQLDEVYTPAFAVDSKYAHYFEPTPITDEHGRLVGPLADELLGQRLVRSG